MIRKFFQQAFYTRVWLDLTCVLKLHSVRVSNELGASHPRTAKFSLVVALISASVIALLMALVLIIFKEQYPSLFSNDSEVQEAVKELTPMLALCIVINNVQPVLSGVAVGAGWQSVVAYVNIACYYIFGIPLGLVFGFILDFGVKVSHFFILVTPSSNIEHTLVIGLFTCLEVQHIFQLNKRIYSVYS